MCEILSFEWGKGGGGQWAGHLTFKLLRAFSFSCCTEIPFSSECVPAPQVRQRHQNKTFVSSSERKKRTRYKRKPCVLHDMSKLLALVLRRARRIARSVDLDSCLRSQPHTRKYASQINIVHASFSCKARSSSDVQTLSQRLQACGSTPSDGSHSPV